MNAPRMIDVGGGHRVWTQRVGRGPVKLLLLHGGPGADHCYFECFADFLPPDQFEFYYYEQLDSHLSDQPGDPALWTVEHFREEVETVRRALGLDRFYLLGHSWGGMLAIEYALAHPEHLQGLIICNMTAGMDAFRAYVAKLRAALPAELIAVMDRHEAAQQFDEPEYLEAVDEVYKRHLCRLDPWPEPVQRDFGNFNPKIYNHMWGPTEFVATGTLKNWERWADLPRIGTRTLVMGAQYDEMNPDDLRKMAALMPDARVWIGEQGSHLAMWDDQAAFFRELLAFLR